MDPSQLQLRENFRTIEASVSAAVTGDDSTANAKTTPLERLCAHLAKLKRQDAEIEVQFSIPDPWSRSLFAAQCRRYGLQPYRYRRQTRTIVVKVPRRFVDEVLWPEFGKLDMALAVFLKDGAERAIREEIHSDSSELPVLTSMSPHDSPQK